jgi:hypothetical protein
MSISAKTTRREFMTELQATTTSGTSMVLDEATVQGFKTSLRGPLLCPGDAGYNDARQVWNGMIDRRPALIVCCSGPADVMHAVNFARVHNLLVSVRGGGHNAAGNAVCDGGIVIDLSRMKGVQVDPERRTARVQGGVTWGELDHETQVFGLATPGGVVSTTGVVGLTLGGGLGWLRRKYGLSCDNLLSADVVTADGRGASSCRSHPSTEQSAAPDCLQRPLLRRVRFRQQVSASVRLGKQMMRGRCLG